MRLWKTCWILWISCGMALGNYGFLFGKPPNVQKPKGNLSWRSNEFLLVHVWRFGHRVMLCLNLMLCGHQLKLFYLLVLQKHFLFVGSSTWQSFIKKPTSSPWKLIWLFRKWCVFLCVFVSKTSVIFSRTCTKLCKSQQIHFPYWSQVTHRGLSSLSGLDVDARSNDSAEVPWQHGTTSKSSKFPKNGGENPPKSAIKK